jgi:tetratricopeptide (TPR) repeat protein
MKKISAIAVCVWMFVLATSTLAQKAEDHFKDSQARLRKHDINGALASLDKAIALNPNYVDALMERSNLYMMTGNPQQALPDLDRVLTINTEVAPAYVRRGNLRMHQGDFQGALSDFDSAIVRGYRSDDVYGLRGDARLMSQDVQGALSDYNAAISMNPLRIRFFLGRASARSRAGDEDGALADYSYVIENFEKRESARQSSGKPPRQAPAAEMTSPVMRGAEKTAPGNPNQRSRADLIVTSSPNSAMSAEQMEYLPNVAGAYMNRARLWSKKGNATAAMSDLDKAVSLTPDNFFVYFSRGKERLERGDAKGAVEDLNKAIELYAGMALIFVERGAALMALGRDDEAEKDFEKTLALDPDMKVMVEMYRNKAKKQRENKP